MVPHTRTYTHTLALLAFAATPGSAQREQTGATLAARFHSILTAEYATIARGDTAALRQRLSDDLVWVVGPSGAEIGKAALLSGVGQVQSPTPQFSVDSVRAREIEGVALVEYLRADRRAVGSYAVTTRSRCHDVFRRRGSGWMLERHSQTWVVAPAEPIAEPPSLDDFVGRYRIADDYVDDVHRDGARLVATASGQTAGATLIPVSIDAFSPDGVGALMVFERDRTGRVVGYVQGYPDGRVVRAQRLP
jgi:hypothetical protein